MLKGNGSSKGRLRLEDDGMDTILINGKAYSKKKLCLEWFQMDNDSFFREYGFNFNPHKYPGLYEWGRRHLYGPMDASR